MSQLESFIHHKMVVLRETDTAMSAAKAMYERRIGCILVANHKGGISGIVTDRDLVNSVLAEEKGPNTRLRDLMTKEPCTLPDHATVPEAIEAMKKHGVRRIPVVRTHKDGVVKCVGLVTLDDLIAAQAVTSGDLAQIVKSQIYMAGSDSRTAVTTRNHFLKTLSGYFYNTEAELENFSASVFESLFKRLHYSSAVQFMWQLPEEFQARLSQVAPGPDVSVTVPVLIDQVAKALRIPPEAAPGAVQKLWVVLHRFADSEALDTTMAQLPEDIQALFCHPSGPMRVHAG